MKILHLDIETAPNKVYAWGLWGQDIHIDQIVEAGYTLCWAAKWHGQGKVLFDSIQKSGKEAMVQGIYALIEEADAVCHYNGAKFDMPTLNREFILQGLQPPPPYKQIDLLQTARRQFRFPSNKLDYIAQQLGLGSKTKHKGMQLWNECMDGDEKAWRTMERYNKQDVRLLEKLYLKLLPWIQHHPNHALYQVRPRPACKSCGSMSLQQRGYSRTTAQVYRRYQCKNCGTWQRGKENVTLNKETVHA